MNDQILFFCLEVQEFKQVARAIGADAEALGRFMVNVDVIEAQGVLPCVPDVLVGQTVPVGRLEYLLCLSVTRLSSDRILFQCACGLADVEAWWRGRIRWLPIISVSDRARAKLRIGNEALAGVSGSWQPRRGRAAGSRAGETGGHPVHERD